MFDPWVGKIPQRRPWQPTPVFLPGKFHRQRRLTGYSPWGHKELEMTEQLTLSLFHIFLYILFHILIIMVHMQSPSCTYMQSTS